MNTANMIYSSRKDKHLFLINFKCMYSSFKVLNNQGLVKTFNEPSGKIATLGARWKLRNMDKYIIVRNPYERLKSFYVDKFVRNIHQFNQFCQIEMLNYVRIEKISSGNFSFEDFIETMRLGYSDGHINRQSCLYNYFKTKYKCKDVNIIHLENKKEMDTLKSLIGSQELPRKNADKKNRKNKITLSNTAKAYIKEYYKEDFINFGYAS